MKWGGGGEREREKRDHVTLDRCKVESSLLLALNDDIAIFTPFKQLNMHIASKQTTYNKQYAVRWFIVSIYNVPNAIGIQCCTELAFSVWFHHHIQWRSHKTIDTRSTLKMHSRHMGTARRQYENEIVPDMSDRVCCLYGRGSTYPFIIFSHDIVLCGIFPVCAPLCVAPLFMTNRALCL